MATKADKERTKLVQDKCQTILSQLLRDEDNKYCVDCDAKGPRWASWNLGLFLCIRCAGIHRNLGVHISKVKSVNLDTWTPEQVACLQQMGNSRARAVYEANLPDNFRRPQTDSSLEAFVRAKYEQKKYIAKEWKPPPMPKPAFEIEDEKKKQKEKKTKSSKTSGLEFPLPSAGSSGKKSPLSNLTNSDKVHEPSKSSGAIDLLGLNEPTPAAVSPEDPFGGFLSADSSSVTVSSSSTVVGSSQTQEEGSTTSQSNGGGLFELGQITIEDPQKKQMSKESILSLYSQGPSIQQQQQQHQQQQQQQQQQMMGIQGGVYVGQQPNIFGQQPVQALSMGYPGVMGTNMMQGASGTSSTSMFGGPANPQSGNIMGTNPFLAGPGGPMGGGIGGWFAPTNLHGQQQHVFGQLQHQMASLSMGNPPYGAVNVPSQNVSNVGWVSQQQPGHTLSTNLWQ